MNAREYSVEEILRDGGSIHIRAIRPDDKPLLLDHFHHLGERSVYFRFFGTKKRLSPEELKGFTEPDFIAHVGLVATLRINDEERIIGVGRYIRVDDGTTPRAEVAFAVRDEHQGRGIGSLLLEHLSRIARAHGVGEFEAEVLGENNQMLQVFRDSGFQLQRSRDGGVVHVSFRTEETPEVTHASRTRERIAAVHSLQAFFSPRAVAVVGASRRPGTIGQALMENIMRCGFTGALYPINPHAAEIAGIRAYSRLSDIGAPIDLAVIAVPAASVEPAVKDCATAGVRSVVVISSGFAEVSEAGRDAQRRLTALVRGSGMRMIGPNCMGLLNTDPAVSLNATFAPSSPPAGNVAMLSQSGALGLAILDYVREREIGLSSFVSVGNKADVSGNDLLAYWAEDPRTQVILLYLESFGNPRKFARVAPEVARCKPIIAVKSGRSPAGSRAASSHSAALANLDVAVDALFAQAGVIRTDTLEELFDVAALLATQPVPSGPRVGVVTNAGGPGILLADAGQAHGLQFPMLSEPTLAALRSFLPAHAGLANPIDLVASATADTYARAIPLVGNDPNVDSLVVIHVPIAPGSIENVTGAIALAAGDVTHEKPIVTVMLSSRSARGLVTGPRGSLPTYTFPENAARALAAAVRYAHWRARAPGAPLVLDRFARDAVRSVIDRICAATHGPQWVAPKDLAVILRAAGLDMAAAEQVAPADAAPAAERFGYPLVAKIVAPSILHKSDVGGVIMGLETASNVTAAVETLVERTRALNAQLDGILLQREVRGGIEAFVGVTTDPTFGPLVICGLGGVNVELTRDISLRLTPVTDADATEMLDALRSTSLLDGYRGAPPADRPALIDLITRVSALVDTVPELRELDLNPVKVLAPGKGCVVVDARMRVERVGS